MIIMRDKPVLSSEKQWAAEAEDCHRFPWMTEEEAME